MANFFKNRRRAGNYAPKKPARTTKAEDLMDPILYSGGLDLAKFPILPIEKEHKPEEEPENPLNKR
ncbi:MAG: hypothetical protein C3F02_04245 [Parcubacteria group bacterium]|nr:MAG: hypothetical protein C3F02_04245 [Parcubacteria group bacterium]